MKRILSVLLSVLSGFTAMKAQTVYKIGDMHPCGGIVFSVNATGDKGYVVATQDVGRFAFAEAAQAVKSALGDGWIMPNKDQLNEIYLNVHKKGLGDFKPEMYRSGQASAYPMYPHGQHFGTGKQEGCALNNKVLCRPIKAFPCVEAPKSDYSVEIVSGNGQSYSGGGMPQPMVIKIKDKAGLSISDLKAAGLSINVTANKPGQYDGVFSNLNNACKNGDNSCFGGYYYVESNTGKAPYDLIITVSVMKDNKMVATCNFVQKIK